MHQHHLKQVSRRDILRINMQNLTSVILYMSYVLLSDYLVLILTLKFDTEI